jgi:hypothetical protein
MVRLVLRASGKFRQPPGGKVHLNSPKRPAMIPRLVRDLAMPAGGSAGNVFHELPG